MAEALGEQVGFRVEVVGLREASRERRISLQFSGPVPFWEAIGRLEAGRGVRHDPGASYEYGVRDPSSC